MISLVFNPVFLFIMAQIFFTAEANCFSFCAFGGNFGGNTAQLLFINWQLCLLINWGEMGENDEAW